MGDVRWTAPLLPQGQGAAIVVQGFGKLVLLKIDVAQGVQESGNAGLVSCRLRPGPSGLERLLRRRELPLRQGLPAFLEQPVKLLLHGGRRSGRSLWIARSDRLRRCRGGKAAEANAQADGAEDGDKRMGARGHRENLLCLAR